MFDLLFYLLFGYLVINYERPLPFAAGYVVVTSVLSLIIGSAGFVEAAISGIILFAYTAFVYMVVDRYGDKVLAPIGVLIAGYAVLVAASFYLG